MSIPDPLHPRVEALLRGIAHNTDQYNLDHRINEARAIVAELPEPVDPDQEEAELLAYRIKCGGPSVALALAALKRGRELAGNL